MPAFSIFALSVGQLCEGQCKIQEELDHSCDNTKSHIHYIMATNTLTICVVKIDLYVLSRSSYFKHLFLIKERSVVYVKPNHLYLLLQVPLPQPHTNPWCRVTQATGFYTVVPHICGSLVWVLLCGVFLALTILRWLLDFWSLSSPYILGRFMQKIVCLIAGPVLINGFNAFHFRKLFEIEKYLICCHRSVVF